MLRKMRLHLGQYALCYYVLISVMLLAGNTLLFTGGYLMMAAGLVTVAVLVLLVREIWLSRRQKFSKFLTPLAPVLMILLIVSYFINGYYMDFVTPLATVSVLIGLTVISRVVNGGIPKAIAWTLLILPVIMMVGLWLLRFTFSPTKVIYRTASPDKPYTCFIASVDQGAYGITYVARIQRDLIDWGPWLYVGLSVDTYSRDDSLESVVGVFDAAYSNSLEGD